jgi:hypothetical protein
MAQSPNLVLSTNLKPGGESSVPASVSNFSSESPFSSVARNGAILLLGLALILPLWVVKYPPLVDYPEHLARAFVLHHLNDSHQIFNVWYKADWGPYPYLTVDLLMQILQYVFGIYTAGRIFLSICVISLPLATWFFLHRASPGNEYLALWSLVVAYDSNFLMGFLSFELSISMCLIVIGVWLSYLESRSTIKAVGLSCLITLLYFTHLGGFIIAGLVLTLHTLANRRNWLDLIKTWLLFVPAGSVFLYVKLHSWAGRGFDYSSWHFLAKVTTMAVPFRGYSRIIDGITLVILALCLLVSIYKNQALKFRYIWLAIALAILGVHWVVPDIYGDLGNLNSRFPPFAFLVVLASPSFGRRRSVMLYGALAVFLLRTSYNTDHFVAEQPRLEALASSFSSIPESSLVLAYAPPEDGPWVQRAEIHFWAYGIIDRGWISPTLFHQKGVQPLDMRKSMYLGDDPNGIYAPDAQIDWQKLRQQYDFVWSYNVPSLNLPLSSVGRLVFTSGKLNIFGMCKESTSSACPAK